jgi:hypothetical protein
MKRLLALRIACWLNGKRDSDRDRDIGRSN